MSERGEIFSRELAGQLRDFRGLRWHKITPTDVDGLIEFHNNLWIFFELKFCREGHQLNVKIDGQFTALSRTVDALQDSGKKAFLVYCSHSFSPEVDILCHQCVVRHLYFDRVLRPANRGRTLWEFVEWAITKHGGPP